MREAVDSPHDFMLHSKTDLLQMKPDDTVLLPITTPLRGEKILDLQKSLNFLSLTFPDRPGRFALILSEKDGVKQFYELGLNLGEKLYFNPVRIKDLFSMLMVNQISLIVDPFGDELVILTPKEMCNYCEAHQEEIYKEKTFDLPAYTNFRIAKAKENGPEAKMKLLAELVDRGIFYVVSSPIPPLAPNISRIGKLDTKKYLMIFSSAPIAAQFCQHAKQKEGRALIPIRLTMEQLEAMDEVNTGASMFFLNDGAESMSFSFYDLREVFREKKNG